MKHLDLFSGIGGFALAARWAGIETVAFCEKDEFCQKVLLKHWPNARIYSDIKTMQWIYDEKIDLITAGFPCQPFSVAGKKKGKEDDRYLWPEVIRVIRECRPNWLILENVPGIIPMLDPILKDLEAEDYDWETFLIPASAMSAPHKRERLWIIANCYRERCDIGGDNREKRPVQIDWQQHIKTVQSEWTQFQPESWTTFNAQEWLGFTANASCIDSAEKTEDMSSDSERSERPHIAATIGDVNQSIGIATNSISSERSDQYSPICQKKQEQGAISGRENERESILGWQKDQPPVPGVDDGLPNGLDRNKALGNAIVPQIPYLFMRMIQKLTG